MRSATSFGPETATACDAPSASTAGSPPATRYVHSSRALAGGEAGKRPCSSPDLALFEDVGGDEDEADGVVGGAGPTRVSDAAGSRAA
ncbi:hypothetical protein ACIHEJ_05090 [Streptomyces sp. NPDC052301]|uniref:hypothetical protein n=1 Tax=Streptomyces sp. NPDC052301 TaxID=3365687 RepID=UPI0037CF1477